MKNVTICPGLIQVVSGSGVAAHLERPAGNVQPDVGFEFVVMIHLDRVVGLRLLDREPFVCLAHEVH